MTTASVRQALVEQWRFRADSEAQAALRFRGLHRRLGAHGASQTVLELCERAIADERRHRDACAREAERWGGAPRADTALTEVAAPRIGDSPERRLQFEIATMCCVVESVNATYLAEIIRRATDPGIRERTRAILADEVWHARLGWLFLRESRADLSWMSPLLPSLLRSSTEDELWRSGSDEVVDESVGLLGRSTLQELLVATTTSVILPGLAHFGLDERPARRWLAQLETRLEAHGVAPSVGPVQRPPR